MSARLGLGRSRAFEVARRSFSLPDLTTLDPVAKVTDPVETHFVTTYYDTADLRLAARHSSVRRTQAGWLLRTRGDDGAVVELEAPAHASDGAVPAEVVEAVVGAVRDRRLEPVASVRTARVERRLLDIDGRELARLADDVVDGQRFTTGCIELSHWRQLTVELSGGATDLLELVVASLDLLEELPTGDATLHRALGGAARPVIDLRGDARDGSAAGVLRERLRTEVGALVDHDRAVRTGRPDAVVEMRNAAVRLRCDLATWKPFLDDTRTEPIRRELRWLAAALGRVRDAEVVGARLLATLEGLPADMVVGPVRARVEHELAERATSASH
ncbi:MAG: CHAD domain-containing protein, partial [Acidimicrobiia bacterium]|nr:CHAD domain-containing protein [Acidimicrobiia bacterium]